MLICIKVQGIILHVVYCVSVWWMLMCMYIWICMYTHVLARCWYQMSLSVAFYWGNQGPSLSPVASDSPGLVSQLALGIHGLSLTLNNTSFKQEEDGEMTLKLEAFVALAREPSSIPSTHTVTQSKTVIPIPLDLMSSLTSIGSSHAHDAHICSCKTHVIRMK